MRALLLALALTVQAYALPGATVETTTLCGPLGRSVVHVLTATDDQAQVYNLQLETRDLAHVWQGGLSAVEGHTLTWLPHRAGDQTTAVLTGGPCDVPAPLLSDRWSVWLPAVTNR